MATNTVLTEYFKTVQFTVTPGDSVTIPQGGRPYLAKNLDATNGVNIGMLATTPTGATAAGNVAKLLPAPTTGAIDTTILCPGNTYFLTAIAGTPLVSFVQVFAPETRQN